MESDSFIFNLGKALNDLAYDQSEWSQSTFGTDLELGPLGGLKHLEKEAKEAQESLDDISEYADCLILILDASRRAGFSPMRLIMAAQDKMKINRGRKWGKTVPGQPTEHIRD